jgi:phospholipid/cholesterol/gamma-HCH transport system permease protein
MWIAEFVGRKVLQRCAILASILAILWATIRLAMRPTSWTPAVRDVLGRQLLFTGVDGVYAAFRFGAAAGILIIVQSALRVESLGGTTDVIAPLLWRTIVRELAPLLACLVVIGRSGVAITTELATMLVNGEIEVLDAQGIDPMTYLVMPRILAVITSVFCLAIITATSMIVTGCVFGWCVNAIRVPWTTFFDEIIRGFRWLDLAFFVPKTIIAGGFAGAICCIDGLSVRETVTDVPRISSRSVIHALTAVFIVSAILSALIYGQILMYQVF